jgi:hypothetical protein
MRATMRYLVPASLMFLSGAFLLARGGMGYAFFDEGPLVVGGLVYALAALWWIVGMATARRNVLLHLLLVWTPAAAPLWLLYLAGADSSGLAFLVHGGPAAVTVLACTAGAFVIFQRALWPKEAE